MSAVTTLSDGATITPDFTTADVDMGQRRAVFAVTLGGNRTLAAPVGAQDGVHMVLRVTQDATGGRTLTWGSAFNFASPYSRPQPSLFSAAGVTTELVFAPAGAGGQWWLGAGPYTITAASVQQWPDWS